MRIYEDYLLPRLTDWACRQRPFMRQRAKVVPQASGRVLEIGMGSGLNLAYYRPERVERIWGLEPSAKMLEMAREKVAADRPATELLLARAEEIPLDVNAVDTIVTTYSMCTIPDLDAALAEMRRVLKPGGQLLFVEHGRAPDAAVRRWQNLVQPLWKIVAGGCHLNRDIPQLLRTGGFEIADLETLYLPGWRPATYNFWGQARPR